MMFLPYIYSKTFQKPRNGFLFVPKKLRKQEGTLARLMNFFYGPQTFYRIFSNNPASLIVKNFHQDSKTILPVCSHRCCKNQNTLPSKFPAGLGRRGIYYFEDGMEQGSIYNYFQTFLFLTIFLETRVPSLMRIFESFFQQILFSHLS